MNALAPKQAPPAIQSALQQAVDAGVFPGAVLAVRHRGTAHYLAAAGRLSLDPPGDPVSASTVYDLASLTKPLATVTSMALLVQAGCCSLDARVDHVLPELRQAPVGSATLRDLLTHSSGLPGWRGFYEQLAPHAVLPTSASERVQAGRRLLHLIRKEALVYRTQQRSLYSDLGFMLLGLIVERLSHLAFDRFVTELIVRPLRVASLSFLPREADAESPRTVLMNRIAPTEFDPWRGRLLRGEVHDENAAALGGVAGHAGLFGTAESVLAISGTWLRAYHGRKSLLEPDVVRAFTRRQDCIPGSSWAIGWDMPSTPSSSGQHWSPRSFGHLGYTGTSMWIDPACELEVVLLSNRVHPSRKNEAIRMFRPAIHDLIYTECAMGS